MEVGVYQNPWEIEQLVNLYHELDVYSALEIGVMWGGTLRHWLRRGVTVVAVDDQMREAPMWERWADEAGANLVLLGGQSQNPELIAAVQDLAPYQFVFIDADHSYEGVKADWENFSPLCDGVVAFHDIEARVGYGVSDLWTEIKARPGTKWMEIVHNVVTPGTEGKCGIGVVWM